MYKQDLALNNLQWFICDKIKPYQTLSLNCTNSHPFVHIATPDILPQKATIYWKIAIYAIENRTFSQNQWCFFVLS